MSAIIHVPRPEDDPGQRDPDAAGGRAAIAARRVRIAERRARVAELILLQVPQREIARRERVGLGTVSDDVKAIKAMWAERAAEAYDAHAAREQAKLDAREKVWLPLALAGDEKADQRCTVIAQERAKLLGLYKPTRVEHSGSIDVNEERERGDALLLNLAQLRERKSG